MCHGRIRDALLPSTGGWSTAPSAWFRGCNSPCLYITGVQYCCYGDGLKWAGNLILTKFYSWAEEEGSIFSITYGIFFCCLGHTFCKQRQTRRASCVLPPGASSWKSIPAPRPGVSAQGAAPEPAPTPAPGANAQIQRSWGSWKVGNWQLKWFINFNLSKKY